MVPIVITVVDIIFTVTILVAWVVLSDASSVLGLVLNSDVSEVGSLVVVVSLFAAEMAMALVTSLWLLVIMVVLIFSKSQSES